MELPHLGKHCSKPDCNKLDFLPIKCDACNIIFCDEHYSYSSHNCPKAYEKNFQVPACPLCSKPVPVQRGQLPDFVVSAHIDNDCQSDPARSRRKVFSNKCSFNKCKNKEVMPVICPECSKNFCVKHRHPDDHNCDRKKLTHYRSNIQGNISEDEALARALALSMNTNIPVSKSKQEELDLALAKQLQAGEGQTSGNRSSDRCNVS